MRVRAVPSPSAMKMASRAVPLAPAPVVAAHVFARFRDMHRTDRRVTVRDRPAGARARSARRSQSRTCACRCRADRPGARSPPGRGRACPRSNSRPGGPPPPPACQAPVEGENLETGGAVIRRRQGPDEEFASTRVLREEVPSSTQSGPPVRRAPPKIRAARRATAPRGARRRPEVSVTGRAEVTFIASG